MTTLARRAAAFTALAGLAGVCASQTTVVVSQSADIRSTNPGANRGNTTDGVVLHIVEGLILLYNGIDTWAVRKRVTGFSVWEGKPRVWNTQLATAP